jgi:L-rhamnose mutarotase
MDPATGLWARADDPKSPTSPTGPTPFTTYRLKNQGRRIAQIVKLKPEFVEKYKECHARVWPEVLKQIKDSNIEDCKRSFFFWQTAWAVWFRCVRLVGDRNFSSVFGALELESADLVSRRAFQKGINLLRSFPMPVYAVIIFQLSTNVGGALWLLPNLVIAC